MVRHKQSQSKYAGQVFLRLCSSVVFGVAEWERHYRRANWPGKYGWRSLPPAHWPPPPTIALVSPDLLHLLAPGPQPLVARGPPVSCFPPLVRLSFWQLARRRQHCLATLIALVSPEPVSDTTVLRSHQDGGPKDLQEPFDPSKYYWH